MFLYLVIFIVTLLIIFLWNKYTYWSSRGVPTPFYLPVLGHLFYNFAGYRWRNLDEVSIILWYDVLNIYIILGRKSVIFERAERANGLIKYYVGYLQCFGALSATLRMKKLKYRNRTTPIFS